MDKKESGKRSLWEITTQQGEQFRNVLKDCGFVLSQNQYASFVMIVFAVTLWLSFLLNWNNNLKMLIASGMSIIAIFQALLISNNRCYDIKRVIAKETVGGTK